jgi:hypothetical protein
METRIIELWDLHPLLFILVIALALFDVILRLIAMWQAARNNQRGWYVALAIFSTAGILPIIYLSSYKKN